MSGATIRVSGRQHEHNLWLVEQLRRVAVSKDATVAQVAIAWVLARGADIVPLVGARRRERLTEALGAMKLTLTGDNLQQIERAVPANAAAGERYAAAQLATLDSEAKPSNREESQAAFGRPLSTKARTRRAFGNMYAEQLCNHASPAASSWRGSIIHRGRARNGRQGGRSPESVERARWTSFL